MIFVEVGALADLREQSAQIVGANRAVHDVAFADVRLRGVRAHHRSDVRVEIDAHLPPAGYPIEIIDVTPNSRQVQRRQRR